jgi:hypothetical protein
MINTILLGIVGLIYVAIAFFYVIDGKTGLAIAFAAYALANYGLWLAGR